MYTVLTPCYKGGTDREKTMNILKLRNILLAMLAFFAVGVAAGCSSSEESSDSGSTPDELCDAEWEQDREGCN